MTTLAERLARDQFKNLFQYTVWRKSAEDNRLVVLEDCQPCDSLVRYVELPSSFPGDACAFGDFEYGGRIDVRSDVSFEWFTCSCFRLGKEEFLASFSIDAESLPSAFRAWVRDSFGYCSACAKEHKGLGCGDVYAAK